MSATSGSGACPRAVIGRSAIDTPPLTGGGMIPGAGSTGMSGDSEFSFGNAAPSGRVGRVGVATGTVGGSSSRMGARSFAGGAESVPGNAAAVVVGGLRLAGAVLHSPSPAGAVVGGVATPGSFGPSATGSVGGPTAMPGFSAGGTSWAGRGFRGAGSATTPGAGKISGSGDGGGPSRPAGIAPGVVPVAPYQLPGTPA